MAKGKSENKSNGGSKGSVAERIAQSTAGRQRKQARRKQGSLDAVARAKLHTEAEHKKFQHMCAQASGNYGHIVDGTIGKKVLVAFAENDVPYNIVVEVILDQKERPAVKVVGSDFSKIPANEELYLSTWTLPMGYLKQFLPEHLHVIQQKLWCVLKLACHKELAVKKEMEPARSEETQTSAPAQPMPKAVPDGVLTATALKGVDIIDCSSATEGSVFNVTEGEGQKAYFRKETNGGAWKLTLIHTDEGHPLEIVLDKHEVVQVDIGAMVRQNESSMMSVGDLGDLRQARKYVTKYLREIFPRIGLRIKTEQKPVPEEAVA